MQAEQFSITVDFPLHPSRLSPYIENTQCCTLASPHSIHGVCSVLAMADSEKPTINVRNDEVELLDTIRRLAPKFNVPRKRAEIYGVWTICYHRFCDNQDRPAVWMDSVSAFMDFLSNQARLSDVERNQALDAVMFYLTDIRHAEDQGEIEEVESFPRPTSARSLFAHLLLRCDIDVQQALKLRVDDVDTESATIGIREDETMRTIKLLPSLRSGMRAHMKRIVAHADDKNPLLFGPDAPTVPISHLPDEETDQPKESVKDATEAATRVMKTLMNTAGTAHTKENADADTKNSPGASDKTNTAGADDEDPIEIDDSA